MLSGFDDQEGEMLIDRVEGLVAASRSYDCHHYLEFRCSPLQHGHRATFVVDKEGSFFKMLCRALARWRAADANSQETLGSRRQGHSKSDTVVVVINECPH